MDIFTLLDNIKGCNRCSIMNAFNGSIYMLRGLLRSDTYALDSTIIETRPGFPGCGMTKRKKEGRTYGPPEYEYIHGFKMFALYEVKSRIIVAIYIVPANESDHNYFLHMVGRGVRNCGRGRIKLIIADRGFLDGAHLWEIKNKLGIDFIIPAKAGMIVRDDAVGICNRYADRKPAEWNYGKDKCCGYGVDGLLSYFEYNPGGVRSNSRTNGTPLNALVVTTWRGKAVAPENQVVLLTSLPVGDDAASIAKKYRLRTLIENCGFRELKQASYLKHLPARKGKNTENAAYMHIILCAFAHTLFYAFLGWRRKRAQEQSGGDCMRSWRRREGMKANNQTLIVVEGGYYALFSTGELLDCLGVRQKHKIEMNC